MDDICCIILPPLGFLPLFLIIGFCSSGLSCVNKSEPILELSLLSSSLSIISQTFKLMVSYELEVLSCLGVLEVSLNNGSWGHEP